MGVSSISGAAPMSQQERQEKSTAIQKIEKLGKGQVSIPKGELADMKKEYKRLVRKRRDLA